MKIFKLLYLALLCLSISLVSCTGEDGKDGIDGIDGVDGKDGANGMDGVDGTNGQDGADGQDGVDGTNGADGQDGQDGADGQDGQNGAGFDEMTKYGEVISTLSGTRPDGIPFEDMATFKFTPIDADDFDSYNIVSSTQIGDDMEYDIAFRRFYSSPDGTYNINFIQWELVVLNLGQETQNVQSATLTINNYGVIGDDNKYFMVDDVYASGGAGVSEMAFTDMVFDPNAGNHLTFSYSFTVDVANNDSGHELSVSGTVDVNLLELIQP